MRAHVKYSYEAIKKKRRRKKKRRETALCKKETLASFFVLSHSQIFLFCLKEKQRGPGRRDKKETNHEKIMGYLRKWEETHYQKACGDSLTPVFFPLSSS